MAEIRRVPIVVLLKYREEARAQGMTLDEYCDSLMEQLGVQEIPDSQVRNPVGIVGTRHHKMTGELCEIPGIYRPELPLGQHAVADGERATVSALLFE